MDSGGSADDNKEEEESSMLRSFFCCCIVLLVVSLVRIRRGSGDGKKVTRATTSMAERTRKAQCLYLLCWFARWILAAFSSSSMWRREREPLPLRGGRLEATPRLLLGIHNNIVVVDSVSPVDGIVSVPTRNTNESIHPPDSLKNPTGTSEAIPRNRAPISVTATPFRFRFSISKNAVVEKRNRVSAPRMIL